MVKLERTLPGNGRPQQSRKVASRHQRPRTRRVLCSGGAEVWAVDAATKFGTKYHFEIAGSPLVVGDLVICTLWHRSDLRRPRQKTGRTRASRSLGEESGYCSPIGIAVKGRRLL